MRQVVARIDVDYKRPILFRPEPYVVETWVTRVGTSSFGLACRDPRRGRHGLLPGRGAAGRASTWRPSARGRSRDGERAGSRPCSRPERAQPPRRCSP